MRQRLCAYLRTRRQSDWGAMLALSVILVQFVASSIAVYAQTSQYRFSSKDGRFTSLSKASSTPLEHSVETALAVTEARIERNTERLNQLESGIGSVQSSIYALEHRLVVLERVNENLSKLLNLSYGMVISIASALIVSIVNMRMQSNRRNRTKEDLRELLAEMTGGKP